MTFLRTILGGLLFAGLVHPAMADSLGSASGGTRANQSSLAGCAYVASAPTLTDGQQVAAQCDANGNFRVTGTVTTSPTVGSTFSPAQVTLNNSTATIVLASLATPNGRNICNADTAINEFIGNSGVTTSTGIKLTPGSCWDASHTSAAIYAIAASGTPVASGVQY